VRAAWDGIDPAKMWDGHCHLAGTGDSGSGDSGTGESGSGIYLNSALEGVLDPLQYAQRLFFMNAGCVRDVPGQVDRSYVERLRNQLDDMRPGAKLLLLAFDASVTEAGAVSWERTSLYVPNRYAAQVAQRHAQYFEWAASVHPYRRDCVEQLEAAAGQGARALKWLPATMGIDPASRLCDPFYAALARLDLPLITHAGLERALRGRTRRNWAIRCVCGAHSITACAWWWRIALPWDGTAIPTAVRTAGDRQLRAVRAADGRASLYRQALRRHLGDDADGARRRGACAGDPA